MKRFLLGFIAALVLLAALGFGYIGLGFAPVATSSAPLPLERLITHIAMKARVKKEAPQSAPIQPSDEVYTAGAQIYRGNCAVCHGLPGQEPTAIARGEFPRPPQFFEGKGVLDDPPGETYWKIANGIRLTGMPGFSGSLSSDQMWRVTLLLCNGDNLPPDIQAALREPSSGQPAQPANPAK